MKAVALSAVMLLALVVSGCGAPAPSAQSEAVPPADSIAAEPETPAEVADTTPPAPAGSPAPAGEAQPMHKPVEPAVLPKLYDFWATWCPPCREQSPIIEELKAEYAGKVDVIAVNVDEQSEMAKQYEIKVIPTLVFVDAAGKEVERRTGLTPKSTLVERFKALGFID
ncbi:MAG: thioredoxin domain-containing protein [bacterium]